MAGPTTRAPGQKQGTPAATALRRAAGLLLAVAAAAWLAPGGAPDGTADVRHAQATVVDSALSPAEAFRRFVTALPDTPRVLGDVALASTDALVRRFVGALSANDTTGVVALMLTRAEFAWLYYPHTRHTRSPYRMSPALLWFLTQQESRKGLVRAFRAYGGKPIRLVEHECAGLRDEGPNRIRSECTVTIETSAGPRRHRLFGAILERDGRFKLLSLANEF